MPTPPKTVCDAAETWLKRCAREGLDTQTLKTYRSQVANHILPPLGETQLAELRRADVKAFVEEMLDGNSREMTRKVLVSLKSLLKEAVEREWIQASPASDVKLKRQKRHDKQAETYGNIMRRIYYPLQLKAGITDKDGKPKYGFHALRHACASLVIEQGWPVKKIQTILGHSSVVMTLDVYGHLFTRAEDDVALFDKLESDLMEA